MSENEVFSLKEMMKDITEGQKELLQSFNNLRVEIVERYATKAELKTEVKSLDTKIDTNKTSSKGTFFSIATIIIAIAAIFVSILK